jgi:hypothetical protein
MMIEHLSLEKQLKFSPLNIKSKFIIECLGSYCSVDTNIEKKITAEAVNLLCYFLNQTEAFDPSECFQFAHLHIMMLIMNLDLMAVFSSKSAVKTPENKMIKLYIM